MKSKLLLSAFVLTAIVTKAQVSSISENFDNFTTGTTAAWPQNNWSKVQNSTGPWVYADGSASNKYIQYYSFMAPNAAGYLITPQIVAPDGTKTLSLKASVTTGSASGATGTIQIGLVDNTTDMTNFTPVGNIINLTATDTTYNVTIPASTKQYIAIKIIGSASHTAIQVDDVNYNSSTLAVTDLQKNSNDIKFVVNNALSRIDFYTKENLKNIEIFSANGQKVASGAVQNKSFTINTLPTGIYYILIENNEGKITKSKFIKQ